MLSYEFMILHDWELNEAEFVHIDLKPLCIPNAQRVATSSHKNFKVSLTWQVYYIPSAGQQAMWDSEMVKVTSHHPNLHYPSLWYFHWLIGIINTQV